MHSEVISLGCSPRSERTIGVEKSLLKQDVGLMEDNKLTQSWERLGFDIRFWSMASKVPYFRSEVDRPIGWLKNLSYSWSVGLNFTCQSLLFLETMSKQFCDHAIENLCGRGFQSYNYSLRASSEINGGLQLEAPESD